MKKLIVLIALLVLFSCENNEAPKFFKTYDETELIKNQQDHKISRMKFMIICPTGRTGQLDISLSVFFLNSFSDPDCVSPQQPSHQATHEKPLKS